MMKDTCSNGTINYLIPMGFLDTIVIFMNLKG